MHIFWCYSLYTFAFTICAIAFSQDDKQSVFSKWSLVSSENKNQPPKLVYKPNNGRKIHIPVDALVNSLPVVHNALNDNPEDKSHLKKALCQTLYHRFCTPTFQTARFRHFARWVTRAQPQERPISEIRTCVKNVLLSGDKAHIKRLFNTINDLNYFGHESFVATTITAMRNALFDHVWSPKSAPRWAEVLKKGQEFHDIRCRLLHELEKDNDLYIPIARAALESTRYLNGNQIKLHKIRQKAHTYLNLNNKKIEHGDFIRVCVHRNNIYMIPDLGRTYCRTNLLAYGASAIIAPLTEMTMPTIPNATLLDDDRALHCGNGIGTFMYQSTVLKNKQIIFPVFVDLASATQQAIRCSEQLKVSIPFRYRYTHSRVCCAPNISWAAYYCAENNTLQDAPEHTITQLAVTHDNNVKSFEFDGYLSLYSVLAGHNKIIIEGRLNDEHVFYETEGDTLTRNNSLLRIAGDPADDSIYFTLNTESDQLYLTAHHKSSTTMLLPLENAHADRVNISAHKRSPESYQLLLYDDATRPHLVFSVEYNLTNEKFTLKPMPRWNDYDVISPLARSMHYLCKQFSRSTPITTSRGIAVINPIRPMTEINFQDCFAQDSTTLHRLPQHPKLASLDAAVYLTYLCSKGYNDAYDIPPAFMQGAEDLDKRTARLLGITWLLRSAQESPSRSPSPLPRKRQRLESSH